MKNYKVLVILAWFMLFFVVSLICATITFLYPSSFITTVFAWLIMMTGFSYDAYLRLRFGQDEYEERRRRLKQKDDEGMVI